MYKLKKKLRFQLSFIKSLKVITHVPITQEKNLNKLKMNDFPWIYQRTKVRESTTTVKSGDTGE